MKRPESENLLTPADSKDRSPQPTGQQEASDTGSRWAPDTSEIRPEDLTEPKARPRLTAPAPPPLASAVPRRRLSMSATAMLIEAPPKMEASLRTSLEGTNIRLEATSIASAWVQIALDSPDVILVPWSRANRGFVDRMANLPQETPPVVVFSKKAPKHNDWSALGVSDWIVVPDELDTMLERIFTLVKNVEPSTSEETSPIPQAHTVEITKPEPSRRFPFDRQDEHTAKTVVPMVSASGEFPAVSGQIEDLADGLRVLRDVASKLVARTDKLLETLTTQPIEALSEEDAHATRVATHPELAYYLQSQGTREVSFEAIGELADLLSTLRQMF